VLPSVGNSILSYMAAGSSPHQIVVTLPATRHAGRYARPARCQTSPPHSPTPDATPLRPVA